jgi:opacity protein-like surface antigen
MKKIGYAFATVLVLLSIGAGSVLAAGVEGNVNLLFGMKYLEEDDWEPVEDQLLLGVMFDITPPGSPVAFAVDFFATGDEDDYYDGFDYFVITGNTSELDLGIRWYTPPSMVRGYIGGGLALVNAEKKVETNGAEASEDDNAVGFSLNGGLVVTLINHLNLGLNARYSQAEVDIAGIDVEAGGFALAGLVGYHF